MEEATGAPSSFADWDPRRLRASGRDGGSIVNRPPSSLTMLLSRHTRRREFITLVGGAATWPLVAHAQQSARVPTIGVLGAEAASTNQHFFDAFRHGMREHGYLDGRNIAFVERWAGG